MPKQVFMDLHHLLFVLCFCFFGYARSNVKMCNQNESVMRNGLTHYYTRYYCCLSNNLITEDGNCTECSIGYKATEENTCVPCDGNAYGKDCLQQCQCSNEEICDHKEGCISIFKSTADSKSSQYSKGTEWPDYKSAYGVATSFQLSKSSHSFSTGRPDVKQNVHVQKKGKCYFNIRSKLECVNWWSDTYIHNGSSSLNSSLIIYVVCTGSLAVIIGLSIPFRWFCFRQTSTFVGKQRTVCALQTIENENNNDEFLNEIFELERHGSIYDIIDEQNMIEYIEHLQDDMNNGDADVPHYDLD